MSTITTTFAKIKAHIPCKDGYRMLAKSLGGITKYGKDTPITFEQIYASNGYDDTIWCLRATDEEHHNLWRHFAVDVAKSVEHLMTDQRSKDALVVARWYADGKATDKESAAARAAARDAACAAAWAAAGDAAWAAQMCLLFDYCREGKRPENSEELLKQYIKEEMENAK